MRFERIRRNDLNATGETFVLFVALFLRKRKSMDDKRVVVAGLFGYINSKLWLDNREKNKIVAKGKQNIKKLATSLAKS